MNTTKIIVFADKYVGEIILKFLISEYRDDLYHVVLVDGNHSLFNMLTNLGMQSSDITWGSEVYGNDFLQIFEKEEIAHIVLAWWPHIIKQPLLSKAKNGIINFHPSYLPFNRGKDPNFWSIAEDSPAGVSLQIIDESIDGGDIIFQSPIKKTWDDTGKSLYDKSVIEIIKLFIQNYPIIRKNNYERIKQNPDEGSFHFRKEINAASEIFLEKAYKARDLINLIRARTFPPHPSCYFYDEGKKYEIRTEIIHIEE